MRKAGLRFFWIGIVGFASAVPAAGDVVLNDGSGTSDFHPSAVAEESGALWAGWNGYAEGADGVYVRRVEADGSMGAIERLDREGGVPGPPELAEGPRDSIFAVWAAERAGRWGVRARRWNEGAWGDVVVLSGDEDAIYPCVAATSDGVVVAAWSERINGHFRIVRRMWRDGSWGVRDVEWDDASEEAADAFRPAIATGEDGEAWLSWDEHDGAQYGVRVKRILPEESGAERLSGWEADGMNATMLVTGAGKVVVAWLEKYDVIGGAGAISQWHTLHAAALENGEWTTIVDAEGERAAAELTQGLMAKIAPKPAATGGYLGRRTSPMLLDDGEEVWLLWERKSSHSGSTPNVTGDLCARPMSGKSWGEPVVLMQKKVDYHLAHPARGEGGKFVAIASELPRKQRRPYHRIEVDLGQAQPFVQEEWAGWERIELPVERELTERRELEIDGVTYQLYWADMHCHNGLTTDAEGQPDELTYYARDRAKLDVVVFTNNDYLYDTFLTEYEYALGNFFARIFTEEGNFLSLPGFEWTARVPGAEGVPFSEPSTWTPPYANKSYPNHRSVVYPPSGGPLVRFPEVGNDIEVLNRAVEVAGGVTLTQHDRFLPSGHAVEVAMELTSGWGRYINRRVKSFHDPLAEGARMGFVANGDSHRRAPGLSGALTGIYAEELTAELIIEALKARRCFATDGSRYMLDSRANGVFMGGETKVAPGEKVTLTLHAEGTRVIREAALIRDGVKVKTVNGDGTRTLKVEVEDVPEGVGKHWYYWRVLCEGKAPGLPGNVEVAFGPNGWTTPVWVVVE